MIPIFDNRRVSDARLRALQNKNRDCFFLFDWTRQQIEERLSIIRRKFQTVIQIGIRGGRIGIDPFGIEHLIILDRAPIDGCDAVMVPDFLPFAKESIDLMVSVLDLHTVNDLPGALIQARQALKPDGLFLAAMLGGETLFNLRDTLTRAEMEITGGLSPRIAPFADKQQMGALMQRAGFALPVVDSDFITATYKSVFHMMRDLRAMGEGNAVLERQKTFTRKRIFLRAQELYAQDFAGDDGRLPALFEIIFMIGWAPHASQQKPLRPGSAQNRLAEALKTVEIKTGDMPV